MWVLIFKVTKTGKDTDLQNSVEVVVGADQLSTLGLEDGAGDDQVEVLAGKTSPEDLRREAGGRKM